MHKLIDIKKGLKSLKNPLFYFGLFSFILFGMIYFTSSSSANFDNFTASLSNSFFKSGGQSKDDLFFDRQAGAPLETPDLKITEDNSIAAVSTPQALNPKVLGDILGTTSNTEKKEVVEYTVQPGDSLQTIAQSFNISTSTLLWANGLASSSGMKAGQILVILPTDGIIYVVKPGDTISALAKRYKSKSEDIVAFNELSNEGDIYIGDVLILPGGIIPPKASAPTHIDAPLADNFFIFPAQGKISQGIHYYNAVDIATKCGSPIYAAASGTVQRVKYGWNFGGGNYLTILHANGTTTYYGHIMNSLVNPGDKVNVGDRIALVGGGTGTKGDGISTGCHVHFGVTGAKNPLAKYSIGTAISLK